MKILFATNFFYLPQRTGGSESSTNDLCNALVKKNHEVAVVCTIKKKNSIWLKNRVLSKIYHRKFIEDKIMCYPVYRGYDVKGDLPEVIEHFNPDVVVVQAGNPFELVNRVSSVGIPVVLYVRDVEFEKNTENLNINNFVGFVSNSKFTASKLKERFGVDSLVLPPLIDFEKYKISKPGNSVVHIGLSPLKGIDISFKIAKSRSDIPFVFVESWPLPKKKISEYKKKAETMGNVTLLKRSADMKKIYQLSRILLAPSVCEEAWGRVVTEAQSNGIPIIASNRGGLPESVGQGGIIVPHDAHIDSWIRALSEIWDNTDIYSDLSLKALLRAKNEDISRERIIEDFIDFLTKHVRKLKRTHFI